MQIVFEFSNSSTHHADCTGSGHGSAFLNSHGFDCGQNIQILAAVMQLATPTSTVKTRSQATELESSVVIAMISHINQIRTSPLTTLPITFFPSTTLKTYFNHGLRHLLPL